MNIYKAFGLKKARPGRLDNPGLNAPAMGLTPGDIRRREQRVKESESRLEPGGDWAESLGRAEETAADVKSGKLKSVNPQQQILRPQRERAMYDKVIREDKVGPDIPTGGKDAAGSPNMRPRDPSKASERGFEQRTDPYQRARTGPTGNPGMTSSEWKSGPEFARQVIAGDSAARPGGGRFEGYKKQPSQGAMQSWTRSGGTPQKPDPQITPSTQAAKAGTTLPKANVKQYNIPNYAAAGKPAPKPLVGQGPLRPGQTRAPATSSAAATNIKTPKIKTPKIKAPANVGALGSAGMGSTSSGSMGGGMGGSMGGI